MPFFSNLILSGVRKSKNLKPNFFFKLTQDLPLKTLNVSWVDTVRVMKNPILFTIGQGNPVNIRKRLGMTWSEESHEIVFFLYIFFHQTYSRNNMFRIYPSIIFVFAVSLGFLSKKSYCQSKKYWRIDYLGLFFYLNDLLRQYVESVIHRYRCKAIDC